MRAKTLDRREVISIGFSPAQWVDIKSMMLGGWLQVSDGVRDISTDAAAASVVLAARPWPAVIAQHKSDAIRSARWLTLLFWRCITEIRINSVERNRCALRGEESREILPVYSQHDHRNSPKFATFISL
jgi:hypothetical protein